MQQTYRSLEPKKSYVESWPNVPDTPNPRDPKLIVEKVLMMVGVFLPIQIVFGIIFFLVKNLFD